MRAKLVAIVMTSVAMVATGAEAESYAYDAMGRVISFVSDAGVQTIYSYDASGNRTGVTTSSGNSATAPVAVGYALTTGYGSGPSSFDPRANDSDPAGRALTLVGVSPPSYGSASFTGSSVTYTPPSTHVTGSDVFSYTIQNTAGLTASAVVTVTLQ